MTKSRVKSQSYVFCDCKTFFCKKNICCFQAGRIQQTLLCPGLLIYETIIEWHSILIFCNSTACCFTSFCARWKFKSCNEASFRIWGYILLSIRKKKSVIFIIPDSSTVVLLLYTVNYTPSEYLKYIYCLEIWKLTHIIPWNSAAVFGALHVSCVH